MCGIAGLISPRPVEAARLRAMTDRIAHRGPDDEGVWIDEAAHAGLGHRRLAVIDPSPQGHQPMLSHDGRYVLVYNGEVYNYAALRRALEAAAPRAWRGRSDSETLLEAIAAWGLAPALRRCAGMFALALWDRRERRLHLARDRFGEKPLYYGWTGGEFVFGSELKGMLPPDHGNPVSRAALRLLAARTYIPAPLSIFEHVYKLEPGCILTVGADAFARRPAGPPRAGGADAGLSLERYWSYKDTVLAGLADPIADEGEAEARLEAALSEAIAGQAEADVPVGAFLSGGIDSSLVVALYRKLAGRPVRTFTIGFEDPNYDEADHARQVARHFGAEHHARRITAREAAKAIPLLPAIYDEPFADSSQIPTYLLSRFARGHVTVALTGDGGDELFGGYARYVLATRLWGAMRRLPPPLRAAAGRAGAALGARGWDRLGRFGRHAHKGLRTMRSARDIADVYQAFLDEYHGEAGPVLGADAVDPRLGIDLALGADAPDAVRMMHADATSYLPDDILCKVDRAAMACGLETRLPFLDHRVAEVAARIPLGMKLARGHGKLILRKLLYREAPAALFQRPKAGFAVPLDAWLRGPLRDWAEALLDERRLRGEGWFDPALVRRRWEQHLSGARDGRFALWPILMFQAWREAAGEARALPAVARFS